MNRVTSKISVATALAMAYCLPVMAQEAGTSLSPAGAFIAGNQNGSIPSYNGKAEFIPGWLPEKPRIDYSKYKDEKPILTIDATNVDNYSDKLSAGQVAFIKQTKGYAMDIYPSHRDCTLPDFAQQNSKKNITEAKTSADGDVLLTAQLPGVPFPIPKNGAEVMWNFLTRYRGVAIDFGEDWTLVSPRLGSSDFLKVKQKQFNLFPWARQGSTTPKQIDDKLGALFFQTLEPAALAGQGLVGATSFGDVDNEAYYYFPGQRRVRRLPNYQYDSPSIGYENQYMVDQLTMFTGKLDRFDWKLVGKKEMYVPYNSFAMYDFRKSLSDVYGPQFINKASRRYELHRVWEVVATVKAGQRHSAPTKVFYVDEDSWNAVVSEDLDAQNKLWKVREGFSMPAWEIGGACDIESFVQYDLIDGRYVADQVPIGTGSGMRWLTDSDRPNDPRMKMDFYTPDNLRSVSDR